MKTKSQAAMIRALLARKCAPEKVLERVRKEFPKQKPTLGYVNAIAKESA